MTTVHHTAIYTARGLSSRLLQLSSEIEETRNLPPALMDELVDNDIFRLLVPKEAGGAELDPSSFFTVIEELGKGDASTAWCVCQNAVSAMIAAYMEPSAAKAVFGTPTGIIAWGPGDGKARRVGGGFRLTGRFQFASGSRHATWLGAHVSLQLDEEAVEVDASGSPVTYTLMFPRSEAVVTDIWHVMGLNGTGSDAYEVKDLFVPEAMTVRRERTTKPRTQSTLYLFGPSSIYAIGFAGVALGVCRAAMDAFIELARTKKPAGDGRLLKDNAAVQRLIGEAEAQYSAARTYLQASIEKIWAAAQVQHEVAEDDYVVIRLATTWAIRAAADVVRTAYDAGGATAIFDNGPFERRFRDVHTITQQIQGHKSNFDSVGQIILGANIERRMFRY